MKKFFTLCAIASAVVFSANADTALRLGGGWNGGFAGDADVYTFSITKQWGAAEYNCDLKSADYPSVVIEFEEPCPAGFQINYMWAPDAETKAEPQYGAAMPEGQTSVEIFFNQTDGHALISQVSCQHTTEDAVVLNIKKATFKGADGEDLVVAPAFTTWAGTDQTVCYRGTVSLPSQWMQLQIPELTGMSDVTVKVVLAEPHTTGIQLCIDYTEGSEWPQFVVGEKEVTVTTAEGKEIKNFGIQRTEDGAMSLTVEGAYLVDGSQSLETITANDQVSKKMMIDGQLVIMNAGISYNAFGQMK